MFLSRLRLNRRHRLALAWLRDCDTLHRDIMSGFPHVEGSNAREQLGVLFRVEELGDELRVYVQSRDQPLWAFETTGLRVDTAIGLDPLIDGFREGARYRFRLRASPTRRVHRRATQGPDPRVLGLDGHWHEPGTLAPEQQAGTVRRSQAEHASQVGKRVDLRREEDRIAWLQRKGRDFAGFELLEAHLAPGAGDRGGGPYQQARANPAPTLDGRRRRANRATADRITLGTALFDGVLVVTDPERFRRAFETGIGPGKAYGCGLLSLAPLEP